MSNLRRQEDEHWSASLQKNVGLIALDLLDAPLRLHIRSDEVCETEPFAEDEAWPVIHAAISAIEANLIVLPLALGNHVDHVIARNAGTAGSLGRAVAYYEDLPYAARPNVDQELEKRAHLLDPTMTGAFATSPQDQSANAAAKRSLARCYRSQIDESTIDSMVNFAGRYAGRERLWISPLWADRIQPLLQPS